MKTKQSFVSNSSTTVFCIVGKYYEDDQISKFEEKFNDNMDNIISKNDLDNEMLSWDSGKYIGDSIKSMKDNMTLLEFKKTVLAKLQKFDSDITINDISMYLKGEYNG